MATNRNFSQSDAWDWDWSPDLVLWSLAMKKFPLTLIFPFKQDMAHVEDNVRDKLTYRERSSDYWHQSICQRYQLVIQVCWSHWLSWKYSS
jgi:hypothetical protein